jgi:hypothetical protein
LLDVRLVPHKRYRKLEHPGLADQLGTYIVDPSKGFVVRRVALDIAEACEMQSLQEIAADVALDVTQPLVVRKEAARFVAHVGDIPTKGRLRPMALGEGGEDPNGDLRGWGLYAAWPEHMSAEELFGALIRPDESYLRAYAFFLNNDLPERLRPADLPPALAWVEGQQKRRDTPYRLAELMDQIMLRAWGHLDEPDVREAFARAALARLRDYDEILQDRRSVFAASDEPSFRDLVAADDRKRRDLVEEMLGLLQADDNDASLLVQYRSPLLLDKDAGWLIEKLEAETSRRKRTVLSGFVRRAFYGWGDEQHELLYLACQRNPALADEVGRFFDPIALSSAEAEEQRRYHRESLRWHREREEPPSPDPPVSERVLHALEDIEAGAAEAFWHRLDYYLKFDENGRSQRDPVKRDLTALPGWDAADDATRDRIVSAAKRYVLEGEPGTDGWLGEDTIWETHPAYAGYRALWLLANVAPDFVADMPDEVWERWAPVILDYPSPSSSEEAEQHRQLVAMAYRRASSKVIDTVLFLVDKEIEKQGSLSVIHDLKGCLDDRLTLAMLEKVRDERLNPSYLSSLLTALLDHGLDEAKDFAESLVASGHRGGGEERARAMVAAQALVFQASDAGWPVLWPTMQEDDEFARELVNAIASGAHHSSRPHKQLSESEAADLYIWMMGRYPPSEYYMKYRNDGHLTAIGLKQSIAMWRDDIPQDLRSRGTFEACRQIERIMEALPALREDLRWTLYLEDPVKHGRGRKGQSPKPAFLGLMLRDFGLTGYQRIPGLLPEARPTVPERVPSRLRQPVPATTRELLGTLWRHASLSPHFSLREPACCLEVVALWAKVILEGHPSVPFDPRGSRYGAVIPVTLAVLAWFLHLLHAGAEGLVVPSRTGVSRPF